MPFCLWPTMMAHADANSENTISICTHLSHHGNCNDLKIKNPLKIRHIEHTKSHCNNWIRRFGKIHAHTRKHGHLIELKSQKENSTSICFFPSIYSGESRHHGFKIGFINENRIYDTSWMWMAWKITVDNGQIYKRSQRNIWSCHFQLNKRISQAHQKYRDFLSSSVHFLGSLWLQFPADDGAEWNTTIPIIIAGRKKQVIIYCIVLIPIYFDSFFHRSAGKQEEIHFGCFSSQNYAKVKNWTQHQ